MDITGTFTQMEGEDESHIHFTFLNRHCQLFKNIFNKLNANHTQHFLFISTSFLVTRQ